VTFEGRHFTASSNRAHPEPVQQPHPPIWIGGNSGRARQRVASKGQGWIPFPTSPQLATTARTAPLETRDDLVPMLDDLWQRLESAGRDSTVDVHFVCPDGGSPANDDFSVDAHLAGLAALEELGVTWVGVPVPGDPLARTVEALHRYGEEIIDGS